ncbi:MAG: stage II sporulation protein M [Pseudomonadota bacterium]
MGDQQAKPSGGGDLKSQAFRRAREADWQKLEQLTKRLRQRGPSALSYTDILQLPRLYRSAASSLAVMRDISLDRSLVRYLENLCLRAFLQVYAPRQGVLAGIAAFFAYGWPSAVRRLAPMLLMAASALFGGMLLSGWLYFQDQNWFYSFMPEFLASGRTPAASTDYLQSVLAGTDGQAEGLDVFAAQLFVHNALIGLLAFSLGIAFGLPSLILLFYNGLMLGVFVALNVDRGLGVEVGGWLLVHGVTELLAILLSGAAGMHLGWRMAFPGRMTRRYALAQEGPLMGQAVIGTLLLFAMAGLIEGFVRQLVTDTAARYSFAGVTALIWLLYFGFIGRNRVGGPHKPGDYGSEHER